jgi:hypothetical protein
LPNARFLFSNTVSKTGHQTGSKSLRGFLALTGYYRKFIKWYGSIAAPLTAMLMKNSIHNFSQHFIIECNASGLGIEAVLM